MQTTEASLQGHKSVWEEERADMMGEMKNIHHVYPFQSSSTAKYLYHSRTYYDIDIPKNSLEKDMYDFLTSMTFGSSQFYFHRKTRFIDSFKDMVKASFVCRKPAERT